MKISCRKFLAECNRTCKRIVFSVWAFWAVRIDHPAHLRTWLYSCKKATACSNMVQNRLGHPKRLRVGFDIVDAQDAGSALTAE